MGISRPVARSPTPARGRTTRLSWARRNCVVDPDAASDGLRLVARAGDLRAAGLSFAGIAERLGCEGIKPKRGRRFYDSTVRYMLANQSLVGGA